MPKVTLNEKTLVMRWNERIGRKEDGTPLYIRRKRKAAHDLETARTVAAAKQLEIDRRAHGLPVIKEIAWKEFCDEYIDKKKRLNSIEVIVNAINDLNERMEITDIRQFTDETIEEYRDICIEEGRKPGGINRYLDVYSNMGNMMVKWHYATANPFDGVQDAKGSRAEELFYLTKEGMQRYYDASWGNYTIYGMLGFNTGGRPSEILTRSRGDLDLEHDLVHFYDKPQYGFHMKDHARRSVELLPDLKQFAVKYFRHLKKDDLLIKTESGAPYKESDFRSMMTRFMRPKLQMPKLVPYTARHTYAAHTLFKHRDINLLSHQLGHESIRITHEWYAHLLKGYAKSALEGFSYGITIDDKNMKHL